MNPDPNAPKDPASTVSRPTGSFFGLTPERVLAAVRGLGGLLAVYGNTFRMAEYFVIILILASIGVLVTELLRHLQKRLERWRGESAN